jgi:hypothetical protein
LSASSVGFCFHRFCSRNILMDGGAVIVVLAISLESGLFENCRLSCSTYMYTAYRALHSCFPFRSWWGFRLISAMFWTGRVHFGLSPTDRGIHPSRRTMAVSNPHTRSRRASASGCFCMVFSYSNLRDSIGLNQSFWNSGVGTLAIIQLTTVITVRVCYGTRTTQSIWSAQARGQTADFTHTLIAPNRRRPWIQ